MKLYHIIVRMPTRNEDARSERLREERIYCARGLHAARRRHRELSVRYPGCVAAPVLVPAETREPVAL